MKSIVRNGTYIAASRISNAMPENSIHRVIWIDEDKDICVVMRIDEKKLKKPRILSFTKVDELAATKMLLPRTVAIIPQHRLSDQQLIERYPPADGESISAPLEYRRKWLAVLDQIVPQLERVWRKEISLLNAIETAANTHAVSSNMVYEVLYRFIAFGSVRESVVPNTFKCGGIGKKRVGKGYILGRKKNAQRMCDLENDNFPITEEWLEKIHDTHKETIKRGVSVNEAHSTFLNLHCVKSCTIIDGKTHVIYLDARDCPSKNQFRTNGPDGTPEEEVWRKQMEPKEFEKNFRGMYGNDTPETFRTGILADVDSTSNDRYLVSVFNRLRGVGTARTLPVVDTAIGYIFGMYVGWTVNSEAAKLAILNAASDKVEFCARYGISISPDEWYSCLHAEYRADKGEFHSVESREFLGGLNRSIEYVITGRPDLRGGGEQAHHRLHNHNADGSTYGTFRKRGEKDPAGGANQNIFNYTREYIRNIIYHNNFAVVEYLLTTEMRQCGVKPTRKAILEWCMQHDYHHQIAYAYDDLVLALCPEIEAVVTPNGVFPVVRRNGNSGDEMLLSALRYLGPYIEEQRWLERARRNGRWRIRIRINPNVPTKTWYQDPDLGLQTFMLATKDPLLSRLATVHDLVQTKTDETGPLNKAKDEADRARARMKLENEAEQKQARKEKKEQQALAKKQGTSSNTADGRRKNRQDEVAASGQCPVPVGACSELALPHEVVQLTSVRTATNESDDVGVLMEQWLKARQK